MAQSDEEFLSLENCDIKIQTPARILIAGPSTSGKSYLILRMLQNKSYIFNETFKSIYYVFPEYMAESRKDYLNDLKKTFPSICIVEGLDRLDLEELKYNKEPKLLIIDDLMNEVASQPDISSLFYRDSHHYNISYIITLQLFYVQHKFGILLRRNATTVILFKDRGDISVLSMIARKKFPNSPNLLLDAMDWLENNEFERTDQYLVIDNHPMSKMPSDLTVRTQILPINNELMPIYFMYK